MGVHKEITEHSKRQHARVKAFYELDELREKYIEEAVNKCLQGESFSVDNINKVTMEINELARQGIVPPRKIVSKEMVIEYVNRLRQNRD